MVNGFDSAQWAYDSAEPVSVSAGWEDEVERMERQIVAAILEDALALVAEYADFDRPEDMVDAACEGAVRAIREALS